MRMRLIRKSIKNIWQIIVIVWLVFAYQLMLNMVPDEVKLIDGDLSKLDISMPVTFECRDSGKQIYRYICNGKSAAAKQHGQGRCRKK